MNKERTVSFLKELRIVVMIGINTDRTCFLQKIEFFVRDVKVYTFCVSYSFKDRLFKNNKMFFPLRIGNANFVLNFCLSNNYKKIVKRFVIYNTEKFRLEGKKYKNTFRVIKKNRLDLTDWINIEYKGET
jgi:hypothetical protein